MVDFIVFLVLFMGGMWLLGAAWEMPAWQGVAFSAGIIMVSIASVRDAPARQRDAPLRQLGPAPEVTKGAAHRAAPSQPGLFAHPFQSMSSRPCFVSANFTQPSPNS